MALFKARKIQDPQTGEERIVTPEQQEDMLEHGVLLDIPSECHDVSQREDDSSLSL